jgi:hypothetical protein
MPTNFPTSVDNFTNPTANDSLNLPSHSTQHANANDAIEAVESYLLNGGQGLTLVKKQTIGTAVSSVVVTSAFSATYENYVILISGGATSASNTLLQMQLGSTTTGYYEVRPRWSIAGAASVFTSNNASVFYTGMGTPSGLKMSSSLMSPFTAKNTTHESGMVNFTTSNIDFSYGYLNNTTSYTDFTITPTSGGTITGGTIYVYGYGIGQ